MGADVTVYFIRHGQTGWNKARRIQGQIDAELNDHGRSQAARNGRILAEKVGGFAELPFVASPLWRTSETMEIVRENAGLPRDGYATDDRLKEIHFGEWQGEHWGEIDKVDPDGLAARNKDPFHWRPVGGESYADLTVRAGAWFDGVERDTVCVSHGGVSRALRGYLLKLQPDDITELPVPQDKILILRRTAGGNSMDWM